MKHYHMRNLKLIGCLPFLIACGCSDIVQKVWDNTNTVVVENCSGKDIPKVVVLEGLVHHTFENLSPTSCPGHVFPVRKPTTLDFVITVTFADGQRAATNAVVSFDPNKLTETSIRIDSNRLIKVTQQNK